LEFLANITSNIRKVFKEFLVFLLMKNWQLFFKYSFSYLKGGK